MKRCVFSLDYVRTNWGSLIVNELDKLSSTIVGDELCRPCELRKLDFNIYEFLEYKPAQLEFNFQR